LKRLAAARPRAVSRSKACDPGHQLARRGQDDLGPAGAEADVNNTAMALIDMVDGRGHDAVIDAVGMEAHGHSEAIGSKAAELAQKAAGLLPDSIAQKFSDQAAVDRLDALHTAVKAVRRGGTVSISGVYGGEVDPMPMMEIFDRGVQLRMVAVAAVRLGDDRAAGQVERGEQAGRAVADVVVRHPRRGRRQHRQDRRGPDKPGSATSRPRTESGRSPAATCRGRPRRGPCR